MLVDGRLRGQGREAVDCVDCCRLLIFLVDGRGENIYICNGTPQLTSGTRSRHTQKHTEKTGGGGLEPSAANPDYWDLVPHSENDRSMHAQLPASCRSSYAQHNILHEEPPQRAQIEQAEAATIADIQAH